MKNRHQNRKEHVLTQVFHSLLIACVLALVWPGSAAAQEGRLRFERLTVEDGLSQNTVNAILQDRLGFMWFATEDGLNKYDGYSFTVYRHTAADPRSLPSNTVAALFEDSQGRLWVGTEAGLARHDGEGFISYDGEEGLETGSVLALAEDRDGRLWIGTRQQGIWILEVESGTARQLRHDPADPASLAGDAVYALLRDGQGRMWAATDEGLEQFEAGRDGFRHYRHMVTNPNSPTSNRVRALLEDQRGDLWIGLDGGGLNRLNPETGVFTFYLQSQVDRSSLGDNRVWALLEDDQRGLWVGTLGGLDRFDAQTGRFTHYGSDSRDPLSLSSSTILSLYRDRSGVVWIGTRGGGLSQYKPSAHKFQLYQASAISSAGMSGASVSDILEDAQGDLWVATSEGGLNRLERKTGDWEAYRHDPATREGLSSDNLTSLALDREGDLWIGASGGGLNRLDIQSGLLTQYKYRYGDPDSPGSNTILCLLVDRSGRLWAGTLDAGLDRLDPGSQRFVHYRHDPQEPTSLSDDGVTVTLEAADGSLWVGTFNGGLNRFDPQTETFRRYQHDPQNPDSLSSNNIYSLAESPEGVLWVGTREGLNRLDLHKETVTRYTIEDGIPSDMIAGVLADERGELWISTTNGLARFDPGSGAIRTYTTEDGLQSREFIPGAYYRSAQGEMFFGGVQGFNAFYPAEVRDQLTPPPVVVTAFMKQNQVVAKDLVEGPPIKLSYQDDFISFEFAALDFNAPEKNRYAYQLEGFDEAWVEAGTRNFTSYTNLPGGEYTFRVRAANSDGAWNETGVAIPLTVTPPLWEMKWFQGLALVLVSAAGYGSYHWRLRSIRQRNLELEQKVVELSNQVREAAVLAERNRMARDLHDSVTQSLYSLTLLTEAGLRMIEAGELEEGRENQKRLGEIAHQVLQEMRLMVYQLRPPVLAKTGLAGALEQRLEAVERRAGVSARLIVEGEITISHQAEEELYYLTQEALNNALKHAQARTVVVRLQGEGEHVRLEVKDDGRGFAPEAPSRGGLGLTSMRERAERLGGRLAIQSAPGVGTSLRFSNYPEENESSLEYIEKQD